LNGSLMLIIYVVAFIAIFYFMAIRPQQRQRRTHQALLSSLKKGDQIVTAAGMYGTVKRVDDNIVVVEISKGVSIKIARRAVAEIVRDKQEAKAVAPEPRGKASTLEIEEQSSEVEDADVVEEADATTDEVADDEPVADDRVVGRLSKRRK
jgi:preprotein translocase subunit YajC